MRNRPIALAASAAEMVQYVSSARVAAVLDDLLARRSHSHSSPPTNFSRKGAEVKKLVTNAMRRGLELRQLGRGVRVTPVWMPNNTLAFDVSFGRRLDPDEALSALVGYVSQRFGETVELDAVTGKYRPKRGLRARTHGRYALRLTLHRVKLY